MGLSAHERNSNRARTRNILKAYYWNGLTMSNEENYPIWPEPYTTKPLKCTMTIEKFMKILIKELGKSREELERIRKEAWKETG